MGKKFDIPSTSKNEGSLRDYHFPKPVLSFQSAFFGVTPPPTATSIKVDFLQVCNYRKISKFSRPLMAGQAAFSTSPTFAKYFKRHWCRICYEAGGSKLGGAFEWERKESDSWAPGSYDSRFWFASSSADLPRPGIQSAFPSYVEMLVSHDGQKRRYLLSFSIALHLHPTTPAQVPTHKPRTWRIF